MVQIEDAQKFAEQIGIQLFETSAKDNINVEEVRCERNLDERGKRRDVGERGRERGEMEMKREREREGGATPEGCGKGSSSFHVIRFHYHAPFKQVFYAITRLVLQTKKETAKDSGTREGTIRVGRNSGSRKKKCC